MQVHCKRRCGLAVQFDNLLLLLFPVNYFTSAKPPLPNGAQPTSPPSSIHHQSPMPRKSPSIARSNSCEEITPAPKVCEIFWEKYPAKNEKCKSWLCYRNVGTMQILASVVFFCRHHPPSDAEDRALVRVPVTFAWTLQSPHSPQGAHRPTPSTAHPAQAQVKVAPPCHETATKRGSCPLVKGFLN